MGMDRPISTHLLAATAALVLAAAACGDSTGVAGDATVRVLLTDAPADYIASASVDIGAVELIPAGEGEPVLVSEDGTDGLTDLLDLRNAATMLLGEASVESGTYAQMRLVVEAASVSLIDGYTFPDGSAERELQVPSGADTGIKLILHALDGGPFEIEAGETVVVLDFDVGRSFVLQGQPDTPAGIHGVLFKPAVRVALASDVGTISGTVSTELGEASVAGLTVTAEPLDAGPMGPFQTPTVSTTTAEDGTYTLQFVVPGVYTVGVAPPAGLVASPEGVEVEVGPSEDVTGVDFQIIEGS